MAKMTNAGSRQQAAGNEEKVAVLTANACCLSSAAPEG